MERNAGGGGKSGKNELAFIEQVPLALAQISPSGAGGQGSRWHLTETGISSVLKLRVKTRNGKSHRQNCVEHS